MEERRLNASVLLGAIERPIWPRLAEWI